MLNLSRYESYKESEVPDLGEIPVHWRVIRNRFLFREQNERSLDGKETHLCMSQKFGLVPSDDFEDKTLQSESYEGARLCLKGDLVLNRLKAHLSVFSTAPCEGLVSPDYSVFRLRDSKMIPKYFEHLFKTPVYLSEFNRRVRGIVVGFYRLYSGDFNDVRAICPPIEDQQRIVEFLDRKTSEIDQAIAKKQRLIELLQEQKSILINQAVTKGLNPNAPMHDSGIKWMGIIPSHWGIARLKTLIKKMDQGWSPQCFAYQADVNQWGVLKVGCVNGYQFNPGENKVLPPNLKPIEELEIQHEDILVSRANTLELVGSAACALYPRKKLILCDKLYRVRVDKQKVIPEYFVLLLQTKTARRQIEIGANGASSSMQNIGQDVIKSLYAPIPPISEQKKIISLITDVGSQHQEITISILREIQALVELKHSLISNAVTGKIKV
ncbi:MAG TPA: restriction endonuclease subunit S [Coleofasciculaceae cyanobacterium]|jgi:type I restriction enzyme S subunit